MSRALGSVLLRMFGGHGGSPEQDLRERPQQEELRVEESPAQAARKAKPKPLPSRLNGSLLMQPCHEGA
ncbi:hypothetical protein [Acidocella sp.]|uniref:hypothetical protein n=1 Tax=Acidocella sp. TaxID=50710 RepID=UPI003D063355